MSPTHEEYWSAWPQWGRAWNYILDVASEAWAPVLAGREFESELHRWDMPSLSLRLRGGEEEPTYRAFYTMVTSVGPPFVIRFSAAAWIDMTPGGIRQTRYWCHSPQELEESLELRIESLDATGVTDLVSSMRANADLAYDVSQGWKWDNLERRWKGRGLVSENPEELPNLPTRFR